MQYIAALDVGTTTVRCFVLNEKCEIKGSSVEAVRRKRTRNFVVCYS